MLKVGDKMPQFEVIDQDGQVVRSSDFIGNGRKTIVYFYPKDNTSGCTAEACSLRDNYAALTAAGYNVVGQLIQLEVLVNVFSDDWRKRDDRNNVFFLWDRITNSDI